MKKFVLTFVAMVLMMTFVPTCSAANVTFTDVNKTRYIGYLDAVSYLYDNGIVKGYPDGTIRPENLIAPTDAVRLVNTMTEDKGIALENITERTITGLWLYNIGVVESLTDGVEYAKTHGYAEEFQLSRGEFFNLLYWLDTTDFEPEETPEPESSSFIEIPVNTPHMEFAVLRVERKN